MIQGKQTRRKRDGERRKIACGIKVFFNWVADTMDAVEIIKSNQCSG